MSFFYIEKDFIQINLESLEAMGKSRNQQRCFNADCVSVACIFFCFQFRYGNILAMLIEVLYINLECTLCLLPSELSDFFFGMICVRMKICNSYVRYDVAKKKSRVLRAYIYGLLVVV